MQLINIKRTDAWSVTYVPEQYHSVLTRQPRAIWSHVAECFAETYVCQCKIMCLLLKETPIWQKTLQWLLCVCYWKKHQFDKRRCSDSHPRLVEAIGGLPFQVSCTIDRELTRSTCRTCSQTQTYTYRTYSCSQSLITAYFMLQMASAASHVFAINLANAELCVCH